jgi:hypothetical protein
MVELSVPCPACGTPAPRVYIPPELRRDPVPVVSREQKERGRSGCCERCRRDLLGPDPSRYSQWLAEQKSEDGGVYAWLLALIIVAIPVLATLFGFLLLVIADRTGK